MAGPLTLLGNIIAVTCGGAAVYLVYTYPIGSVILAFTAGILVTLFSRFDISVTADDDAGPTGA